MWVLLDANILVTLKKLSYEANHLSVSKFQVYMKFNQNERQIESFWVWFEANQQTFKQIIDNEEAELIDVILNKLLEIQRGIAIEFEKLEDTYLMTVSADGVEDYFEIVQEIIDKSPVINNWRFIAFRQPYGKEQIKKITLTVCGFELDPKFIKFIPIIELEFNSQVQRLG